MKPTDLIVPFLFVLGVTAIAVASLSFDDAPEPTPTFTCAQTISPDSAAILSADLWDRASRGERTRIVFGCRDGKTLIRIGACSMMKEKELKLAVEKILSRSKYNEDGCLIWTGAKSSGYGHMGMGGKWYYVHRVIYEAFIKDPGDLLVCHSCDNPACVNPRHLWLGTSADNSSDMSKKGRGRNSPQDGENNNRAKLRTEDVLEIRRRYVPRSKRHSAVALSNEFQVTPSAISDIVNRTNWKNI